MTFTATERRGYKELSFRDGANNWSRLARSTRLHIWESWSVCWGILECVLDRPSLPREFTIAQ